MARFTGHRCDREGCTVSAENPDTDKRTAPEGWIVVDTQSSSKFEFCSAKCVAKWATERDKFDRVVSGEGRTLTEDGKRKMLEGNLRRWHREGAHDDNPNADCPECQAATAPA